MKTKKTEHTAFELSEEWFKRNGLSPNAANLVYGALMGLMRQRDEYKNLLTDAAFQLGRLDGENLKVYSRTFSALASTAMAGKGEG